MSQGKLYSYPQNPRVFKALIAAKYNNVQLEEVPDFKFGVANKTPEFLASFPFGKVPAFESVDGPLYESNAISYYVAKCKPDTKLFGSNKYEEAQVIQYINVADNEINPPASSWVYPLFGYAPYDKANEKKAQENLAKALATINKILEARTFLVGESVTLADIHLVCSLYWPITTVMDPAYRKPYANLLRWFNTCINQPEFKSVLGEVKLCEKAKVYDAAAFAKKEEPKKEEKKAAVAAVSKDDDEDEGPKEEKKKNPLDLLPPSSFDLEGWKRFYSNNETIPTATDYFWQNFDKSGYSMFKLTYKYNEELAKIFMSCNLITGLFQRMERLRKYAFGSMCVFGEDNSNEIVGMFIFRGPEVPADMKDVPDYDSYNFEQVNTDDQAARKMWNDFIAWEGSFHGGKTFAEGKIFK